MKIELMAAVFHLEGCRSLKEKRRRLSGMKDKLGGIANLALCESGYHDQHRQAEWSFVAMGGDGKVVARILAKVEEYLENQVDAQVVASHREEL